MKKVVITGDDLSLEQFVSVCRENAQVELAPESIEKINVARKVIDRFVEEEKVVYGVTTGFGLLCEVSISKEDCALLQKNVVMSHAVGVGDPFDTEIVRGTLLLRINNFAKGYSGIRLETVETMLRMLNEGVHPIVPEKGSLGASGDLAPMSHVILPMMGLGYAEYKGEVLRGSEAMERAGIPVIELGAKEGVACINGTPVMTSVGALALHDGINLLKSADIAVSLTFEALNGIVNVLDPKVHRVRPHKGQMDTAQNILALVEGSEMVTSQGEIRVQDAYSLRCSPQVHGASKDTIDFIKEKVEIEMNAVTDNPIIFPETGEVISAGNFHGQPMALCFDYLGIALSEIANISERRIERLVNPALSGGLPGFLTKNSGLNSGFMIVQYSAAALVSENKILAHPASVDSIPSSANQEDHVSMGTIGARKAREIMKNVRKVLAMELMCACQGIELRGMKKLGKGTRSAYETVRKYVLPLEGDREIHEDITLCENIMISGELITAVEKSAGELLF